MDSVCPKPSRILTPHAFSICSMTSGLSGSPAPTTFCGGVLRPERSAWMSMRHTVGGAQKLSTPQRSSTDSTDAASNFA